MSKLVCGNVYLPMRHMPSHKAEMVSQVLFGESIEVVDEVPGWVKIETQFDRYSGWSDKKHLVCFEISEGLKGLVLSKSLECTTADGKKLIIGLGSEIYEPDFRRGIFRLGENVYSVTGEYNESYIKPYGQIHHTAIRFINTPYLWGGRSEHGLDCSGLVQLVYKIHGVSIPRDAGQQAKAGELVGFMKDAIPGDLAFFDDERGRIKHVGMILPGNMIIHSSGYVRVDMIDHQGIFYKESSVYSYRLRFMKRFLP